MAGLEEEMGCNRLTTNHKGGPKTKWLQAQDPWLEHRALRWVGGRRASPSPGHCPGTTSVDRFSPTARTQASCHFEPTQACIYRYAGNTAAGDFTPQPETSETLPHPPLSLSPLLWEQGTLFQFPTSCKVIVQNVGKELQNRLEKNATCFQWGPLCTPPWRVSANICGPRLLPSGSRSTGGGSGHIH